MKEKKKELKEKFDKASELAAQMTLDLFDAHKDLGKKALARVFMATMEYPTKPTKMFQKQEELDVYKLATSLKETQMAMGMINLALKEIEQQEEKNESTSV